MGLESLLQALFLRLVGLLSLKSTDEVEPGQGKKGEKI